MNWKRPNMVVSVIVVVAVLLAFSSYLFFNDAANRTIEIAAAEDRSSARILAHDMANSLANKLEGIQQNMQIIAQAPSVQNKNIEDAQLLLETAQQTSKDLTSFYGWLDKDGRPVLPGNEENPDFAQIVGDAEWFIGARDSEKEYASSVVHLLDGTDWLVLSRSITAGQDGSFDGVIAAGIPLAKLNDFLTGQIYSEKEIVTDVVDMNGIILQSSQPELLGMNYLGEEYQAAKIGTGGLQEFVRHALANPPSGHADFGDGQASSVAYSYVKLGGDDFAVVFTEVPHVIAADVTALIEQQKLASAARMAVVGTVAAVISVLIISWNKKLEKTVANRTQALASKTDELVAANEQLKRHDMLQKEFINIAAHELRTPITPILTSIEDADRVKDLDGNEKMMLGEESYNMIFRNAKRLERLSSDILQAARIESGNFKLGKEKFDLDRLASNVVADAYKSKPDSKRDVQVVYEPSHKGDLIVEADQIKLYQVMTNLVQNALKFTTEGRIVIITERDDDSVTVRVKDSGSGIAHDVLPKLFQKFASASSSTSLGGTGLGLYISKTIVEAHGGRIWAENSKDSKGATFSFSLPITKGSTS